MVPSLSSPMNLSEIILFRIKARFPSPKPAAFNDVYRTPVANEASGWRIICIN